MTDWYCVSPELAHSAKGSSWKKHKYVKVIDGVYYYPIGYTKGRTVETLDSKERLSNTLKEKEMKENRKVAKNEMKGVEGKKKLGKKRVNKLANKVIAGKYGVGQDRMDKLGKKYNRVQNRVNQILLGKAAAKKIAERKKAAAASSKKTTTSKSKSTKTKKTTSKK